MNGWKKNTGVESPGIQIKVEKNQIDEKETGRLVKLIADRKFEKLPQTVEKISGFVNDLSISLPQLLTSNISKFENLFRNMGFLDINSDEELAELVEDAQKTRDFVERMLEIPGDVTAGYVQNCTVVSSGNITVNGAGTYNSAFYSGGNVHIEKISRGGEVTAKGDLFIGEAGSPGMVIKPKKIKLSSRSTFRFRKVYENVVVVFGERIYK